MLLSKRSLTSCIKKGFILLFTLALVFSLAACTNENVTTTTPTQTTTEAPQTEPVARPSKYYDTNLIGTWEGCGWDGLSKIYYPTFLTMKIYDDGTFESICTDEQIMNNCLYSLAYVEIIYPGFTKDTKLRESFYGKSKEEYLAYYDKVIKEELPSHIQSKYNMTLEEKLQEDYDGIHDMMTELAAGNWMTFNSRFYNITDIIRDLDLTSGKTLEQAVLEYQTDEQIYREYAMTTDGKKFIFLTDTDEYHNEYPATYTKISD